MMAFYYLCATDMERAIDVINKNPKKRIIESFHIKPQDRYDMLIDPITGDLYEYDYALRKWEPKINAGLHYKQMNETEPILKHMNQRPLFNVKPVEEDYPLIKGVNVEAIIRLDDVRSCHSGSSEPFSPKGPANKLFRNQPNWMGTSPSFTDEPN